MGEIHCGDAREVISKLAPESVDLICTSPPYGAGIRYDKWKDTIGENQMLLGGMCGPIYRVLKRGGRAVFNVAPIVGNESERHPLAQVLMNCMSIAKMSLMDIVVWDKINNGSTAWGSFGSPSMPTSIGTCEFLLVFAKHSYKRMDKKGQTMRSAEFMDLCNNIWHIPPEFSKEHPAVFPERLATRIIKFWSFPGDTVLDPFCGIGTSLMAAEKLGREWIGIDISQKYCRIASDRTHKETSQGKLL